MSEGEQGEGHSTLTGRVEGGGKACGKQVENEAAAAGHMVPDGVVPGQVSRPAEGTEKIV